MEKNENKTEVNETSSDSEVYKNLSKTIPGELCATGSIVEGVVSGIAKFGAFVDLPDKRTGLVHISQIAEGFVREVRDYLTIGQKVNVYIMKCEGEKIRLSIKEAHSKLGIPQLAPLNVGGGLAIGTYKDSQVVFDHMMNNFRKQCADVDHDMQSRSKRFGLS